MRIGTWNVEYAAGKDKNDRRLRRLRDADCDIWVLTETHDELALGPDYSSASTVQREPGRAGGRWTTIWSRSPIIKTVPVDDVHRTVAALIDSPSGPLLVYGTVLPWHADRGPGGHAAGWTEHHRLIPMHGREWAALRRLYPDAALCVAGDLNMNLGGPHYYGTVEGRALLRAAFSDAGLACITETERIPAGLLAHGPIDHICVSEQLSGAARVATAWEGTDGDGVRLSDHNPIRPIGSVVQGAFRPRDAALWGFAERQSAALRRQALLSERARCLPVRPPPAANAAPSAVSRHPSQFIDQSAKSAVAPNPPVERRADPVFDLPRTGPGPDAEPDV